MALSVGANATLIGAAAGLVLVALFAQATTASVATVNARGAAVLSDHPTTDPAGKAVAQISGGITPDPLRAPEDVPDLYAQGCQVEVESAEPTSCHYGSPDAATTIAVVGDSKAAQWVPAFQLLAKKHDWQIETYTKSACPFVTIETSLDGDVYQTCREWTDNVMAKLTGPDKPDVVVTVGQRTEGVVGGEDGDLRAQRRRHAGGAGRHLGPARGRRRQGRLPRGHAADLHGRLRLRGRAPRRPDRLHLRPRPRHRRQRSAHAGSRSEGGRRAVHQPGRLHLPRGAGARR